MKHTKGPWTAGQGSFESWHIFSAPLNRSIASVTGGWVRERANPERGHVYETDPALIGQDEANARLIASAPELLEALKKQSLVIASAQTILADWIVPDSGITDHQALNALLGVLDGPEQRGACHAMLAAIQKAEGAE